MGADAKPDNAINQPQKIRLLWGDGQPGEVSGLNLMVSTINQIIDKLQPNAPALGGAGGGQETIIALNVNGVRGRITVKSSGTITLL